MNLFGFLEPISPLGTLLGQFRYLGSPVLEISLLGLGHEKESKVSPGEP